MPLETSAESPVPVRTALRLVGDWVGRLGRIWVEGQIAELTKRGSTAFLTLRDPVAAVSVRVICARAVLEAADPAPGEGARVVVWAKPEFNVARGSFSLSATEIRAVGIGELLARLERLRRALAAEGLFKSERKRPLPFLPGKIGLICGRDSAAEKDVLRNSAHRWPAVQFRAVSAAKSPVVSAIGHEQDTPLLDLVADVRASTPTDAARRIVPDVSEQLALITQLRGRARRCLTGRMDRETAWLADMRSRPALASPVRQIERRQELVTG